MDVTVTTAGGQKMSMSTMDKVEVAFTPHEDMRVSVVCSEDVVASGVRRTVLQATPDNAMTINVAIPNLAEVIQMQVNPHDTLADIIQKVLAARPVLKLRNGDTYGLCSDEEWPYWPIVFQTGVEVPVKSKVENGGTLHFVCPCATVTCVVVETLTGDKFKLDMELNETTVDDLKVKIAQQLVVTGDSFKLMCNGKLMEEQDTLSNWVDNKLNTDITVCKPDYIKLTLQTLSCKVVSFNVGRTNSLEHIMWLLQRSGIATDEDYRLAYTEPRSNALKYLVHASPLTRFDAGNATVVMTRPSYVSHIFVKTLTGKVVDIPVDWKDTVYTVKMMLEKKEGCPPREQQRLIYSGRQMEDVRTLADYGVANGSTIHLLMCLRGCAPIYVETSNGDRFELRHCATVPSMHIVADVKAKIEEVRGIAAGRQTLCYNGRLLDDSAKLTDYNIAQTSVLQLNIATAH